MMEFVNVAYKVSGKCALVSWSLPKFHAIWVEGHVVVSVSN